MTNEELNETYCEQLADRRAANCYDIYEAAQAIALQLGLNENNTEKLLNDMGEAAFAGELTVRSPRGHDQYAPASPPKTTYCFDSLITPDDVNKWATARRFTWLWISETEDETLSTASESVSFPWPEVMHGQKVWRLSKAIDEIAHALGWCSSQRDALMAHAVKDAAARVLVLRDLYTDGLMQQGDNLSELLDYVFSKDVNAWLDLIGAPFSYRLPEAEPAQGSQAGTLKAGAENLKPVQRSAAQDSQILAVIRKAGHDPLGLPVNEPGKPGVKAKTRAALSGTSQLFPKQSKVFDKAWERLRQNGDIVDKD